MNKSIIILITFCALSLNAQTSENIKGKLKYPETKKIEHIDTYFNSKINDPYHWLEDNSSIETDVWLKVQNKTTSDYLSQIPFREALKSQMEKMWNFEKISPPHKEGNYNYYRKNSGLQNQSITYRTDSSGKEEIFLDPNNFSKEGTSSLTEIAFSKDGSKLAYGISEGGTDWKKVVIMDAEYKNIIEDTIFNVKSGGLSWKGNDGFYYSSFDLPEGNRLSAKTDQHKLYYHKLGTKQKEDLVIFGQEQKRRGVYGNVTEDGKYLIISASNSTYGNELYIKDLSQENSPIVTIVDNLDNSSYIVENEGTKLYILTDLHAKNNRVVTVDVSNPKPENWKTFIPETENVLSITTGAGYFYAQYIKDAIAVVKQYDYSGHLVREVKLPGIGDITNFRAKKTDENIYYYFTNYTMPYQVYVFEPKSGKSELFIKSKINFNSDNYESKQIFYSSKDGTKIPMIITYKKGTKLNGKNPTILYGYGGFNISLTPSFSITNAVWMENGGIYAVPNLRGGGEYGKKWYEAGIKLKKQNVFDDFIAAAEYLIDKKYTSKNFLAIQGGSNGGLLVGATMTQRPDLMKVAIPEVGVMDMLRYHKFTSGAGWSYDYGTSEDSKEMFEYLKSYSPVHNVKENIEYPATLITTGDHDDRVVPAHSFKFAAQLQSKQMGNNPTLIRIDINSGHGAGKSATAYIQEYVDIQSFILFNMGITKI